LKIQEFKMLVAVADELHFGRAAERVGIAQPQLSASIRRIEQDVGFAIFHRRPRVSVTSAGSEMVDLARRLLSELQLGTARARAIAAGQIGFASLGFSPPSMCSDLPKIIDAFLTENGSVELKLVEGLTGQLREQLEQRELDIVVTREPIWGEGLQNVRFASDCMNLLIPAGHPAAAHELPDLATLTNEDFVLFPRASAPHYHDRIMLWCRERGLMPKITREAESWLALLGMVGAGMGLSFGTELLCRIPFPGVEYRKLGPEPLDVSFWLSWNTEQISPASAQLLRHLRLNGSHTSG
jgi:DNA-binding transcriptional LysR family regulator